MDMRKTNKEYIEDMTNEVNQAKRRLDDYLHEFKKQLEVKASQRKKANPFLDGARALVVDDLHLNSSVDWLVLSGGHFQLTNRLSLPIPPGRYRVTIAFHDLDEK